MVWPSYFPQGCPPAEATDANVEVIRMVENDPPTYSDFVPHAEFNPQHAYKPGEHVEACGLCVMTDKEDVHRWRRRFKKAAMRMAYAAIGTLAPRHGKVKAYGNKAVASHLSWWKYDGLDPSSDFKTLKEDVS